MLDQIINDERGFVVSAELILIATVLVLGLIVGLAEVQQAVVGELNDVGDAFGRINQSYYYTGFSSFKRRGWRVKSLTRGSAYVDRIDGCDVNECALNCNPPSGEIRGGYSSHGGSVRPQWDHDCDLPPYPQ